MKYLLITVVFALNNSGQLVSQMTSVDDPAKVRERVMKVVQDQREKKDWMKSDTCPADRMPESGGRSKSTAKDCAANPQKCLSKCDADDADSCYALAQLVQENETSNDDVAQVLYRRSCRLGIASGCTNAAANLFEREDADSLACAARTFERSCSQDDPWGCTMNGFAMIEGIGRSKNISEGKRSLDKACEVAVDKTGEPCTRAKELKAKISTPED